MPDLEENERSESGKAREDKTYDLKLDTSKTCQEFECEHNVKRDAVNKVAH